MLRRLRAKLATVFLIIGASVLITHAHDAQNPETYGEPDGLTGADCEGIMMRLDFIANAAQESGKDQTIIIIARRGNGETSRKLASARMRQVADYLNHRISKERIITAEGEQVRGLGQVEFYVGGRLHSIFKARRNRDLVRGCDPAG